ncbi:F0F1 ATP synthase subunit epsilon [Nodularia spumigena]|uniref:ATP synthase epsilon chain n=1 Tax=Nodularia spumigena UHCC 0039 TaxID=1914872 RepID=A0A2S0Q552_NODSP|nr:F0F1 ATP synthase subunit epsilon [Nodularia spumigena]AVZ29517.1 ATP synthase epsilon chain [Nodularia spumigena UHCC 0039]
MKLRVLLPTQILLEETANKINAEAENGAFCILPNHIDFVTALVPGILSFDSQNGEEIFLAVDQGILVKCGAEVLVSTRNAIRGTDLETLQQTVETQFKTLNEREKMARAAATKLEIGFIRGLVEMGGASSEAPT